MGLLDWLTEGVGSDMGFGGGAASAPPGMPPVQPTGADAAPLPPAPLQVPAGFDAAATAPYPEPQQPAPPLVPPMPPNTPATPPPIPPSGAGSPPVPMPQPRPAAADAAPAQPPPIPAPVPASSGAGSPMPVVPGPPLSITPDVSGAAAPPPGATGLLGRAFGLDANRERSVKGALGAGLKSVGENWNKPGLAAFAGSAGAGIEGGQTATDKGYDQRIKALTLAVSAQSAGDKAAYNKNYAAYLSGKLKNDSEKATPDAKKGAWNKPDSQKFIDAQIALARDPEIHASQKMLEGLQKSSDPGDPNLQKAVAAHTALIAQKQKMYLSGVGLNPDQVAKNMANPPGTPQNPHVVTSKEDFDTYVKPGQAYKNPADGKIYIRKDPAATPAGGGASSAPEAPGPAPGTAAAEDDKED